MARSKTSGVVEPELVESVAAEASTSKNLVVDSVLSGASAAQEAAAKFVPAVGAGLRKATYMGFYYVSFGATFSALVVSSLIPSSSFVSSAISDGAEAAKGAYRKSKRKGVTHTAETSLESTPA